MPGFCGGNVVATLQPPLLTDLIFQVIMELAEDGRHLVFVFSEYRTPRYSATLIVHRNHRTMNMWICLVKVDVEAYNVVFAKTLRHKIINILRPTLYILCPAKMRVVEGFSETWRRRRKRQRRDARRAGSGSRGTRRKKARMARDLLVKITTKIVRRSYNL